MRGIDVDGGDREQCKIALDKHLSGVKRPLALLCTGCLRSLPTAHSQYMVAQLEILHDLKSIIGKKAFCSLLLFVPNVNKCLSHYRVDTGRTNFCMNTP